MRDTEPELASFCNQARPQVEGQNQLQNLLPTVCTAECSGMFSVVKWVGTGESYLGPHACAAFFP